MDLDAYVAAHGREWQRLEQLLGRARSPRRLTGPEVDELVDLYQRTATHLSVVQSAGNDPALVGRLSSLVARARGVVAGGRQPVAGSRQPVAGGRRCSRQRARVGGLRAPGLRVTPVGAQ